LCNGPQTAEVAHKGLRVRPIVDADPPGAGTGTALVEAAVAAAREQGCRRLRLDLERAL